MRVATRLWLALAGVLVLSAAVSCDGDGGAGGVIDADAGMDVRRDVAVLRGRPGARPICAGPTRGDGTSRIAKSGPRSGTRSVMPPGRTRFASRGLSAPVDVYVDESGVMHLGCATDSDCLMGLGYVHAHRRFFLMDLNRRSVTGRLATLYGVLGVPTDEQSLGYYATSAGENVYEEMWAKLSPETQQMFHAYAAGGEPLARRHAGRARRRAGAVLVSQPLGRLLPGRRAGDDPRLGRVGQRGDLVRADAGQRRPHHGAELRGLRGLHARGSRPRTCSCRATRSRPASSIRSSTRRRRRRPWVTRWRASRA